MTPAAASPQAAATQVTTIQLEFEFSYAETITVREGRIQQADPIVFDLDDDGIELSNHLNGARFDIRGDGRMATTAFVTGGDAFLALDRNGNGSIDSGRELFGDQHGAANGFEELRKLDGNGDGVINARDDVFSQLRLWRDNGNGITEEGELISLADAGISGIDLAYRNTDTLGAGGNRIAQIASFTRDDGRVGRTADAILNFTV